MRMVVIEIIGLINLTTDFDQYFNTLIKYMSAENKTIQFYSNNKDDVLNFKIMWC